MIYKGVDILSINYNKVNKAFRVLVDYDGYMITYDVMWKEDDTEPTFMERIYQGALNYVLLSDILAREELILKNLIVFPYEYKEIYYFSATIGNGLNKRNSYLFANTEDTENIIREKVQNMKLSLASETIKEKRRKFLNTIKSYIGG